MGIPDSWLASVQDNPAPQQMAMASQPQPMAPPPSTNAQGAMPLDANGTPLSPDMGGLQPAIKPTVPDNAQAPTAPSPEKYGLLKRMLTTFVYNGSQALKASQGLPTDFQLQNAQAQRAHLQAETQQVMAQTELLKDQVPMVNPTTGMPVLNPITQQPMMVPRAYMKNAIAPTINAQTKNATTAANNATKTTIANSKVDAEMEKQGMKLNPEYDGQDPTQQKYIPMAFEEMSPALQSKVALNKATQNLRLAMATGEPQKIAIARQRLSIAQQNANASTLNANVNAMKSGFGGNPSAPASGLDAIAAPEFKLLSAPAQKVLMDTVPTHEQIKDLINQFESMKDDNTPGKFFTDRLKYAAGMHSEVGTAADTIAQLELNRVVGGARILKGASRAIQALQLAMGHMPNVWKDSPQLIYSKLKNVDTALSQIEESAYTYGNKNGLTPVNPAAPTHSGPVATPKGGDPLGIR